MLEKITKKVMSSGIENKGPIDFKERSAQMQLAEEGKEQLIEDSVFLNFTNFIRKGTGPYTFTTYIKILTYPEVVQGFWLDYLIKQMPTLGVTIEILPQDRKEYEEIIRKNLSQYSYLETIDEQRGFTDEELKKAKEENEALQESLANTNVFKVAITLSVSIEITDKDEISKVERGDDKFVYDRLLEQRTKLLDKVRHSPTLGTDVRLSELKFQQLDGMIASMPVFMNKCGTYKEMITENVAGLFPFTSEIRNDQQGSYVMGLNASTFETFAPNFERLYREQKITNKHVVIIGKIGSGKSSLLKGMITYGIPNHKQQVFDFGRDYGMIATLLKEDSAIKTYSLKSVDEGGKIPDENFFSIPIKSNGERLCSSNEYIGKYLIPSFSMFYEDILSNVDIKSSFSSALSEIYLEDPTGDSLSIDKLFERLNSILQYSSGENTDSVRKLINGLEPVFTGIYKNLFSRKGQSFVRDKNLTVYDLYDIKGDRMAMNFVVLYNFLVNVDLLGRDLDGKGRVKRIVIDEAHRLTKNKTIAKAFSTTYKEVRGEGIQLVISTQTVDDIINDEDTIELMHNYGIAVYFGQGSSALKTIDDAMPGEISEKGQSFLKNERVGEGIVKVGKREFACIFTRDEFLNGQLFSKEILSKIRFKDGYIDTEHLDSTFGGVYSNFLRNLEKGEAVIAEQENKKLIS